MEEFDNWIDLSQIPTKIYKNKVLYDWEHSLNSECSFLFDGVNGKLKISDTSSFNKNKHITIEYNNEFFDTHITNITQCMLKKIVFKYGKFRYEIGENIKDLSKDIVILDREFREKHSHNSICDDYISHDKYYYIKCNKCGHKYWIVESSIYSTRGITCPACGRNPRYAVKGINDISTTDPWMINFFQEGENEASKYVKTSREKPGLVCPFCGRINKKQQIQDLYRRKKVHCVCSDGFSYPNKFMFSFFEQLYKNGQVLEFEREQRFDWSNNRFYDIYAILPSGEELLCENHGAFHYKPKRISSKARTLEEEKVNDFFKEKTALQNGIKYYIQLNCEESNKIWIKKSIINSQLNSIFDLSIIDYEECEKFALGNLLVKICEYKNNDRTLTQKELANIFHISVDTIKRYLKSGKELGLCS